MKTLQNFCAFWHKNKTCFWIIFFLILIILTILLSHIDFKAFYLFLVDKEQKNLEFVQMIGGFLVILGSIYAFFRLRKKEQNDFLVLDLQVSDPTINDNVHIIKTKLMNNVNTFKKVKYACLVISRATFSQETIEKTQDEKRTEVRGTANLPGNTTTFTAFHDDFLNKLSDLIYHNEYEKLSWTNQIIKLRIFPLTFDNSAGKEIALIPLPFYYSENIRFGNEQVTFSFPFDNSYFNFPPGIYSVRFFVFRKDKGYHRTTHDIMIIVKETKCE